MEASSANGSPERRLKVQLRDDLVVEAIKLGRAHGLVTINQVICFVLQWAVVSRTITPEPPDDPDS